MSLDNDIILISHEDTSKDITKRGGDKVTAIKPNLADKVANKVAGMVDVVARIVAEGDKRTFSFKSDEVVFGGGRLKVAAKDIPLDVNALFEVYDEANKSIVSQMPTRGSQKPAEAQTTHEESTDTSKDEKPVSEAENAPTEEAAEEERPRRKRRTKTED